MFRSRRESPTAGVLLDVNIFSKTPKRVRPRCTGGRASMTSRIFFAHLRPLLERIYYYIYLYTCIYIFSVDFFFVLSREPIVLTGTHRGGTRKAEPA